MAQVPSVSAIKDSSSEVLELAADVRNLSERFSQEVSLHATTGAKLLEANKKIVELKKTAAMLARALRIYALQPRNSHKTIEFFGNDAREALALYMGIDVKELEPDTTSALNHMRTTLYKERPEL